MKDLKIGKISHYYDKIGVAIVELTADLFVGDNIKISHPSGEFTQQVTSMQIEHDKIQKAKKGDIIGLKVEKPTKEKAEIFKIG